MSTKSKPKAVKETKKLEPYMFPTIGNGITVMASSQEEANEKAAKLQKDLSESSPS